MRWDANCTWTYLLSNDIIKCYSCTSDPFFEQSCKIYKVWKQAIKKAPDFDSKSGHIEKHCGMRSNHYFTRLWLFFILSRVMFFEICWDTEWQLQVTVDARKTHNAKSSMSFYLFVCFFHKFFPISFTDLPLYFVGFVKKVIFDWKVSMHFCQI